MSYTVETEEVLQVMQSYIGDPVSVYEAVLEALETNLVPVLQALETATPGRFPVRTQPKSFHLAGEDLGAYDDAKSWPKILVGGSTSIEDFGAGHKNEIVLQVTVAWPPQVTRREFKEAHRVAVVVQGLLRHPKFAGTFVDPNDPSRILWGQLFCTGFRPVPSDWQRYSGWIATFLCRQFPGNNLWGS